MPTAAAANTAGSFSPLWWPLLVVVLVLLAGLIWQLRTRWHAQSNLRATDARLQMVLDAADCEVWRVNIPDQTIIRESQLAEVYQSPTQGIEPFAVFLAHTHPDDRAQVNDAMLRFLKHQAPRFEAVYRVEARASGYVWIRTRGHAAKHDARGTITEIAGTSIDVTALREKELALEALSARQAEQLAALQATRSQLETAQEQHHLALWGSGCEYFEVLIPENRIIRENQIADLAANAVGEDMTAFWEHLHPDDFALFSRAFTAHVKGDREFYDVTYRARCTDGSWRWIQTRGRTFERDENGYSIRLCGTNYDVTALKQSEEALRLLADELEHRVAERTADLTQTMSDLRRTQSQLVESEKMAALGALVAGVAHEINTPLGIGVTAASHLTALSKRLSERLSSGSLRKSELVELVEQSAAAAQLIERNLDRAAALVRSFKQVAVDQSNEALRTIRLGDYLRDVLTSLAPSLRKYPQTVRTNVPDDLALATYPGAIYQITSNLILNALVHAFDDGQPGSVEVSAQVCAGGGVMLSVRDDGNGMSAGIAKRAFEPFFTTRRGQGGTGLGLHVVFNLVTQRLRGTIRVDSEPGRGSCFRIELPTLQAETTGPEVA